MIKMHKLIMVLIIIMASLLLFSGCCNFNKNYQIVIIKIEVGQAGYLAGRAQNEILSTIKSLVLSSYDQLSEEGLKEVVDLNLSKFGVNAIARVEFKRDENQILINVGEGNFYGQICEELELPIK